MHIIFSPWRELWRRARTCRKSCRAEMGWFRQVEMLYKEVVVGQTPEGWMGGSQVARLGGAARWGNRIGRARERRGASCRDEGPGAQRAGSLSPRCVWASGLLTRGLWATSRKVWAVPRAVENTQVGFCPGMGKAGPWAIRSGRALPAGAWWTDYWTGCRSGWANGGVLGSATTQAGENCSSDDGVCGPGWVWWVWTEADGLEGGLESWTDRTRWWMVG